MVKRWISLPLFVCLLVGCSLPEAPQKETSPIVKLFVGPQKVNCDNPLRNNSCYQVKNMPDKEWELYKGEIMGLQYTPGYNYELQVQKDSLSNSSPDVPEQQWVLIKVIQKVPTSAGNLIATYELAGSVWVLDQFGSPQTLSMAVGEEIPTILFQDDGHYVGSTGCNRFNGSYATENSRIQISSLASTKKMCPGQPGMLEQEQSILKTLDSAERYQLENGRLSIFTSGDTQVLIYRN
jgi:heat shock protein HslJ